LGTLPKVENWIFLGDFSIFGAWLGGCKLPRPCVLPVGAVAVVVRRGTIEAGLLLRQVFPAGFVVDRGPEAVAQVRSASGPLHAVIAVDAPNNRCSS
jgi:hypothetical protein